MDGLSQVSPVITFVKQQWITPQQCSGLSLLRMHTTPHSLLRSCDTSAEALSSTACAPQGVRLQHSRQRPFRLLQKHCSLYFRNQYTRCGCTHRRTEGECDSTDKEFDLTVDKVQLASEKEEAKAIMVHFLKNLGLSTTLAARVTKKAAQFLLHLIRILHTRHRLRYMTGRELTTDEIQKTLLPYLEALASQHGNGLVDVLVNFPNPPPLRECSHKKEELPSDDKTMDMRDHGLTMNGNFRPAVSYALSVGLSLNQIQILANRFPPFIYYSPERNIIPVVNYFLTVGVTRAGILQIFLKRPQIFGCSVEENLKPTMAYLESLGVDNSQWPRMLTQFPALLTYGKEKLQEAVAFLQELGLSLADIGWTVTRFPQVVSYSVEVKLRPTAAFFHSLGVKDLRTLIRRSPQVLGYSLEGNIKPTVRFLIELGFNQDDVVTLLDRFPQVLGLAIDTNIKRKWDYYEKTGWSKAYIVSFPQYFGYSLESRIKPRFEEVMRRGLCMSPARILSSSEKDFQKLLEKGHGL